MSNLYLFGQLIPYSRGVLYQESAVSLYKNNESYSLGTWECCDICIKGTRSIPVDLRHCTVWYDYETGIVTVVDHNSSGGTWVNGMRVSAPQGELLHDNDRIRLGSPYIISSVPCEYIYRSLSKEGVELQLKYNVDWHHPVGIGTFGAVWKARKRYSFGPKSYRAVKTLRYEPDDPIRRARISNEIKTHKLVQHPNICTLLDVICEPDVERIYLVMEFVSGGSLEGFVHRCAPARRRRGIGIRLAKGLTRQICDAVAYLHSHSIVHRDLKPANILLSTSTADPEKLQDIEVKIVDFGLAKIMPFLSEDMQTVCGTPEYAAPEIVEQNYDAAVDNWSIGAIVVFMLTKNTPFIWKESTYNTEQSIWAGLASRETNLSCLRAVTKDGRCLNFVQGLLEMQPLRRMRAQDALQHSWIASGKKPRMVRD